MKPALLLQYIRNPLPEQEHYGFVLHSNKTEIINKIGDSNNELFWLRSCMKPLQASLLVDFDLINHFSLSSAEIAVCCASHAGDDEHIDVISNLLKKIGMKEDDLKCPAISGEWRVESGKLGQKNNSPLFTLHSPLSRKLYHNCSGKHTLMLMACLKQGWSIADYDEVTHELQKIIVKKIAQLGEYTGEMPVSKDGCGLPVCAMPLRNINTAYLNLFLDAKYAVIKNAFIEHPYLIGGAQRLDSEIMNASSSDCLIAKVGACGLCAVVNLKKEEAVIVKISDANMSARSIVTIEALKHRGWLTDDEINAAPLKNLYDTVLKTSHGETIGFIELKVES